MATRLFTRNTFLAIIIRRRHVWSKDNVVYSPCQDIVIPKVTVNEFVWQNLDKWPTKTAMVCAITNRSYTYGQLHKFTQTLSANLRKKFKISEGDTIGVMSQNVPEYPIVALGALGAGATCTTFNHLYTSYEIQSQIELSGVKLIFAHSNVAPVVKEALKLSKKQIPIICIDSETPRIEGTVSFKELINDQHVDLDVLKTVKVEPSDVAFLPYSSGTTGLPKGVELTHKNIVSNLAQQNSDLKHYNPNGKENRTPSPFTEEQKRFLVDSENNNYFPHVCKALEQNSPVPAIPPEIYKRHPFINQTKT